jgi:transposase
MQILFSRCCGMDVHKDSVTACVLVYASSPEPEVRKKEFATHFKALGNLRFWLMAQKVTHVAMESTGVYWRPIWQALEGHFQLILANPYQVKNIPGQKTDARDSQWLAELLAHGLIRPSFVPPQETRDLRDLTRYRVKLTEERNRIHNRIHKVLEDACIKLDTIASDILGATGRAIIEAIIEGQEHPDWLADKAKGTLRGKRADLRLVLRGRITEHHRLMLTELRDDLEFVERKIQRLDQAIAPRVDSDKVERLASIPGVDVITAWTLLAELGSDMQVFSSARHAQLGRSLSGQSRERGQAAQQPYAERESLAAPRAMSGGLVRQPEEELLPGGLFLQKGRQARRPQGHCRAGPPSAHHRVLHSARWDHLPRGGWRLLRPTQPGADAQPAGAQVAAPRTGGHAQSPPAGIGAARQRLRPRRITRGAGLSEKRPPLQMRGEANPL